MIEDALDDEIRVSRETRQIITVLEQIGYLNVPLIKSELHSGAARKWPNCSRLTYLQLCQIFKVVPKEEIRDPSDEIGKIRVKIGHMEKRLRELGATP